MTPNPLQVSSVDVLVPSPSAASRLEQKSNRDYWREHVLEAFLLLVGGFLSSWMSFAFSGSTWGSPAMWLFTPLLIGILLRLPYRLWVVALICMTSGGFLSTVVLPDTLDGLAICHVLVSLPISALGALMVDLVFERSKRELTVPHTTAALALVALVPPMLAGSIATMILPGETGQIWRAWFASDLLGISIVMPVLLVYRKGLWIDTFSQHTGALTFGTMAGSLIITFLACSSLNAPHFFAMLPLIAACVALPLPQALLVSAVTGGLMASLTAPNSAAWFVGQATLSEPLQLLPLASMQVCTALLAVLLNAMRSEKSRLATSEGRFRDAMRFSPIGMGLTSLTGQFSLINESLCRMIGYDGREMAFRHLIELVLPAQRFEFMQQLNKLVAGQVHLLRRDVQLVHKNNNTITARLAASVVRDSMSQPIGLVIQIEDFNERERAKEALRTSEERFEFAVNGSDIGVWDMDLSKGRSFYSQMCQDLLSLPQETQVQSLDDWGFRVHEEDRADTQALAREHLLGHTEFFAKEHRILQKDGKSVWVLTRGKVIARDINGRALRMVGTMTDITQRKQAELALEELHKRMLLATRAAGIGVWEWMPTRTIIWDDQMYALLATDRSYEPSGAQWRDFLDDNEVRRVVQEFELAIEHGLDNFEFEVTFRRRDGEVRRARTIGTIIRDQAGKVIRLVGAFTDVTERILLQRSLSDERNRLKVSLNAIADAVITTDERGQINFMNPAAEIMMDRSIAQVATTEVFDLFSLKDDQGMPVNPHPVRDCLRKREAGDVILPRQDYRLTNMEGRHHDVELTVSPMLNDKGFMGALIAVHDVTHTKDMQRKLTHAASHDALTGLHNRSHFESELARHLDHAKSESLEHVLCFVDLDRFKIVNDSAGHSVGDVLLKNVSKVISQCVRGSDVLARLGGDEFGVLLLNCNVAQAQLVAEKIIDSIAAIRFTWDNNIYDIGASIGVVAVNSLSRNITDAMSQADVACYAAKHAGRNRCSVYEDGQTEVQRHHKEIFLAAGLREAIESNRLVLHAQKIIPIQLSDEETAEAGCHYELLVRMLDRDGNMIPPGAFIPAAERFELMSLIDRWVVKNALKTYGPRIARIPGMSIAINLSANSLSDESTLPFLLDVIGTSPIRSGAIRFEVTETTVMNHMSVAADSLSRLRDIGCKVALDDFGAGVSSYTYLKSFSADYIKIDGAFIRNVDRSSVDWTIAESINQVAHKLGAETIAEFVETNEILNECRRIGIDHAQGYGIAKPIALEVILQEQEAIHGIKPVDDA